MKESKDNTGSAVSTAVGEPVALLQEVADVLAEQNWRGDLVERLRDAARLAAPTQAKPVASAFYWSVTGSSGWDFKWLGSKPEHATRVDLFAAPTQVSARQAIMVDWPPCNPACDPELQLGYEDCRNEKCSCELAKASIARQQTVQIGAPQASAAQEVRVVPEPVLVPKWAGQFHSYQDWVNKAQSRLASPSHRRAVCVDAKDRRCAIGRDFMLARDEDAFPVRYFWECELVPTSTSTAPAAMDEVRNQALEEAALAAEKVQDEYSETQGGKWPELRDDAATGAGDCAAAIRALKTSQASLDEVTGAGKGEGDA